jgi:imidazolonepropionase
VYRWLVLRGGVVVSGPHKGSLNKSATHGSLEVGKVGDLLIVNAPRWEHLIYQMVDPPLEHVVKKGRLVF